MGAAAGLLALIALALAGLLLAAQSDAGRERLAQWLTPVLSIATGSQVQLLGVGAGLPSRIAIERLTLADGEGVWLALDGFVMRWKPAALLQGRLKVIDLAVSALHLVRLPMEKARTEFAVPHLPVDTSVDRFSIDTLVLGGPLIGTSPARLRVDGRLAASTGEAISTKLTIVRTDGGQGRVEADVRLEPATRRLKVEVIGEEADDGLIVRSLGLAPYPPLRFRLVGDGGLEDWRGIVEAEATGFASFAGNLSAAGSETGRQIGIEGRAEWQGGMPLPLGPAIEPGLHIGATLNLAADGPASLEALRIEGHDLVVEGGGRFDPETSAMAAQANVTLGPAAFSPPALNGFRMDGLAAEASLSGRLGAVEIAVAGTISHFSRPAVASANLAWQASLQPAAAGARAVRITVDASEVMADNGRLRAILGPAPMAQVDGLLSATGDAIDLQSARVDLQAATINGSGHLALDEQASDLGFEASSADLAVLQPLLGFAGSGEVRLAARLQGPLLTGHADVRLDGTAKNLKTGIPVVDAALGTSPSLSSHLSNDPASGLAVTDFSLAGANVRVVGEGRTNAAYGSFAAATRWTIADLAPLAGAAGVEADGTLQMDASAAGPFADPDARWQMSAAKASIAGFEARIDGTVSHLGSRPTGEVRGTLRSTQSPIQVATRFALDKDTLSLTEISAAGLGVRATGTLGLDRTTGLWRGELQADRPASPPTALGAPRLSGAANARLSLTPAGGRQSLNARLQANSLAVGSADGEAIRIGDLAVTAKVEDALAEARVDATVHATQVHVGGDGPFALDLRAMGPRTALDVRLDVDGPRDRLDQLTSRLHADVSGGGATILVSGLSARAAGTPLSLVTPVRIVVGSGRLLIGDLDLRVGTGRLGGRLALQPGSTFADVHLQSVPVSILRGWLAHAPAAGTLSGGGGVSTTDGIVGGEMALAVDGLSFVAPAGSADPAISGELRARFGAAGTDVRMTLGDAGNGARLLSAAVVLPVRPEPGSLHVRVAPDGALAGEAHVQADLAHLAEAYGLLDQRLGGLLAGDLEIGGSLSRPEVVGALGLHDGLYENFVTGTLIGGISGRAEVDPDRTVRFTATGMPAGSGSIAGQGQIRFVALDDPQVEFSFHVQDARLVARDDVSATFAGTITYRGGLARGQLAGALAVTPVQVQLRDRLPPGVVILPVIEINRAIGPAATSSAPAASRSGIDLDIELDLPRHVFVRGRGLDSEWAGGLHVGGSTAIPTVAGQVHLVRGSFAFASKRLQLQKGVVRFTGGPVIDPLLDVAAEYRSSELTAFIGVTGPVSDPALVVSSQPPLPESEVLAQVMFGKGTTRLTALESVQLAAALDSLNRGDTFTADALGSIRQFLGLDALLVGPVAGAERGAEVEVGRYFGDPIFVGARRGLADQASGGRVEVEIVPGLALQSDIIQDVQGMSGSIGFQFKHDY
ncbi:MAG: translocation/assembly module TamB domain-containing protein [Rhodospirillales bacterium]